MYPKAESAAPAKGGKAAAGKASAQTEVVLDESDL